MKVLTDFIPEQYVGFNVETRVEAKRSRSDSTVDHIGTLDIAAGVHVGLGKFFTLATSFTLDDKYVQNAMTAAKTTSASPMPRAAEAKARALTRVAKQRENRERQRQGFHSIEGEEDVDASG